MHQPRSGIVEPRRVGNGGRQTKPFRQYPSAQRVAIENSGNLDPG